jgi:DNA-binding transcriptional regulator LsrR (DeoR family)
MPTKPLVSSPSRVSLQALVVARRYFHDGKQKNVIAQELGISRFKVARLLEEAKSAGVVKISIESPAEVDLYLGEELAKKFGIRQVFVAKVSKDWADSGDLLMATAAADYLMENVGAEDVLGISWGSSVARVVDRIHSLPAIPIVQLVGGVRSSKLDTNGSELVRRLSLIGGGEAFPLMSPLVLESESMASALRGEAAIVETLKKFKRVSIALVGIGAWGPRNSSLFTELSTKDRESLTKSGAVADVCGVVLNAAGEKLQSSFQNRTVAISHAEISKVGKVIAVAGGADKAEAVRASLKSGLVDVLVTDSTLAQKLLD